MQKFLVFAASIFFFTDCEKETSMTKRAASQNKIWISNSTLENKANLEVDVSSNLSAFKVLDWAPIYEFNDYSTNINFANSTTSYAKNSVKLTIKVTNWAFRALAHSLQLVFNTKSAGQTSSTCSNSETDSNGNLLWYSLIVDQTTLYPQLTSRKVAFLDFRIPTFFFFFWCIRYGQYEQKAEIDGVVRQISFALNEENAVVATIPHFWSTMSTNSKLRKNSH